MAHPQTMKAEWEEFLATLRRNTAATIGPIQEHETKKAFYAGALVMYLQMSDTDGRTEDEHVTHLMRLADEIAQYAQDISFLRNK